MAVAAAVVANQRCQTIDWVFVVATFSNMLTKNHFWT